MKNNAYVVVGGRWYEGLEEATGYGSVDGLLGANCRHSFGPYLPGTPRAYDPHPRHASGLLGEEVYKLEQKQRAGERAIRSAKRELRGAQKAYRSSPSLEAHTDLIAAQDRLSRRQEAMRRLVAESNASSKTGAPVLHRHPAREWAGDMPRDTPRVKASGRRLDELLEERRAAIKASGLSVSKVRGGVVAMLEEQGMATRDFAQMTRAEQNDMLRQQTSRHAEERKAERGVTDEQVADAVRNPLAALPVGTDDLGRRSQKFIGRDATVIRNPDTGVIITTYRTKSRYRRKLEREPKEDAGGSA